MLNCPFSFSGWMQPTFLLEMKSLKQITHVSVILESEICLEYFLGTWEVLRLKTVSRYLSLPFFLPLSCSCISNWRHSIIGSNKIPCSSTLLTTANQNKSWLRVYFVLIYGSGLFFQGLGAAMDLLPVSWQSVGNNIECLLTDGSHISPQRLAELLKSKKPEDLQEANRLIKNMVKEVWIKCFDCYAIGPFF